MDITLRTTAAVLRLELGDLVRRQMHLNGEAERFRDAARRVLPLLDTQYPRDVIPTLDAALMHSMRVGEEISKHDPALWQRVWRAWMAFRLSAGVP